MTTAERVQEVLLFGAAGTVPQDGTPFVDRSLQELLLLAERHSKSFAYSSIGRPPRGTSFF